MTPTVYHGVPAIRAAFSNWRTEMKDVAIVWETLLSTVQAFEQQQCEEL